MLGDECPVAVQYLRRGDEAPLGECLAVRIRRQEKSVLYKFEETLI
jgi:hypothetical protein